MLTIFKRRGWYILPIIILGLIGISSTCSNKAPVVVVTADSITLFFGQETEIRAVAMDEDEDPLTYSWTATGGTFTTSITLPTVTWQAPSIAGSFTITVTVNDGDNAVAASVTIAVLAPLYDFYDSFPNEDNWNFLYCTHSIVGGELQMVSTHSTAQSVAATDVFAPTMDIPWTYSGDLTIVSSTSQQTDNGISYHPDDTGTFDVEHMWLSIRKNDSGRNWIWVWWIPSLANEWLPWDESCYGNSGAVNPDGQKNTLEMSVDSNEDFTLKVNDTILSEGNDAVNVMESMAGINVTCGVVHLTLRGGNDTTTRWDNIIFDSESTDFTFKSRGIRPPAPPSEEYVDGLLDRIARGEDVTLKTLLKKSLNQ